MNWYAVNTKPRQENFVEVNLQRLGVEAFCPQLRQHRVIRRVRKTAMGPLFPGYLFARFNLDTHYRAVKYARGVVNLVSFGYAPAVVEEEMIESIKSRLQDGCATIQPSSFTPGQVVRIHQGPLQGLEAIFEQEMSDHRRVVLLLRALSYQARVVVDIEQVEIVPSSEFLVSS